MQSKYFSPIRHWLLLKLTIANQPLNQPISRSISCIWSPGDVCWGGVNSTEFEQIRTITTKYSSQILSNSSKYKHIPTNTSKYQQIPTNTLFNYNQIPQNTHKFHQWSGGIWEIGGRDVRGYRARRAVTAHISGENTKKLKECNHILFVSVFVVLFSFLMDEMRAVTAHCARWSRTSQPPIPQSPLHWWILWYYLVVFDCICCYL